MKYFPLLIAATFLFVLSSCTKTTNNTTIVPHTTQAYTIDGVHDLVLNSDNTESHPIAMPITLSYHDSAQQTVTVAISGMPGRATYFVGMMAYTTGFTDAGPWTGVTPFTIPLYIAQNSGSAYTLATYPITLTCTGQDGTVKTVKFNLSFL